MLTLGCLRRCCGQLPAHCLFRRTGSSWRRVRVDQNTPILFGEVNSRGGYPAPYWESLTVREKLSLMKRAFLEAPDSAKQLKDYYLYDRVPFKEPEVRHGDYYYIANLPRDGGHSDWIVTRDSHYGEGYSTGKFEPSSDGSGCGVFSGRLSMAVPQTGDLVRAGWVNLRTPYPLMVMGRPRPINLRPLNCIALRYRGDGRKYKLNLHASPLGKLDINLFDMYNFPLYTRGGPYWTVSMIPVSKLIRVYKGRIQDKPKLNDLSIHQHLSLTLADGIEGPFRLEIDYIAAYYDAQLNEKFAYEFYPVSSLMKTNLSY